MNDTVPAISIRALPAGSAWCAYLWRGCLVAMTAFTFLPDLSVDTAHRALPDARFLIRVPNVSEFMETPTSGLCGLG